MDDLDALQEDLEKLLNNSACRIRYLLSEVIEFEGSDDDSDRKANDKVPTLEFSHQVTNS